MYRAQGGKSRPAQGARTRAASQTDEHGGQTDTTTRTAAQAGGAQPGPGTRGRRGAQQVAVRFRGEHVLRVDDKCRLSIPAGFRQALEQHGDKRLVFVRATTGPCIAAYTAEEWDAYEDKIRALPQSNPVVVQLMRFQVAGNHLAEPDGHGRVVLPQNLREYAGIQASGEVVVASHISRFEIWARDRWQAVVAKAETELPTWSAELAGLGL